MIRVPYLYLYVVFCVLGLIYWTDTGERKIQRANKNGENIETVIGKGLHTADGIVIDSSGRKVTTTITEPLQMFTEIGKLNEKETNTLDTNTLFYLDLLDGRWP